MTSAGGYRNHVAWGLLGLVGALGMWFAWTVAGAIAMFAAIGAAFVLWKLLGSRGSWMALVVLGLGMSGVLGWQAATGARCPKPGTSVYLRLDRPKVNCEQIRTSAGVMAVLFGVIGLVGIAAPIYARTAPPLDELPPSPVQ